MRQYSTLFQITIIVCTFKIYFDITFWDAGEQAQKRNPEGMWTSAKLLTTFKDTNK